MKAPQASADGEAGGVRAPQHQGDDARRSGPRSRAPGPRRSRKNRRWVLRMPEAPGREDEEADAGEEDPGQGDGELEPVAAEARGQEHGEGPGQRRSPTTTSTPATTARSPATAPATRPASSVVAVGQQAGVDGDEGSRQHPLAEQVLQQVRDAQGGPEGVDRRPDAEGGGDDPLPDQAREAGQQDPAGHQGGVAPAVGRRRLRGRHRRRRRAGQAAVTPRRAGGSAGCSASGSAPPHEEEEGGADRQDDAHPGGRRRADQQAEAPDLERAVGAGHRDQEREGAGAAGPDARPPPGCSRG